MPYEYTACVTSMIKSGKAKADAQRICAISFHKKFGISHQAAHKIGDWKGWKKSHGFEDLRITFAGTGSTIMIPRANCEDPQCREARNGGQSKRSSPCLLVEKGETRVAIGAGPDFEEQLKKHNFKPDAVLLTHSHKDHTGGLKNDSDTQGIVIHASKETRRRLCEENAKFEDTKTETWPRGEVKKFSIGRISFEAFPVAHSIKSPCVAFKIDGDVIYAPDFLGTKHWDKWNGVKLAIMDGSSLSRDLLHHERGGKVWGHMSMRNSGRRALKEGAECVVFTHIGHVFHGHDGLKRKIRSHFGGEASVAFDGMILEVPVEGEVDITDKVVSGIYLPKSQAKAIWNGDASAIVKSKPLKTHLFEPLYLAGDELIYGSIELSGGEPIGLKQFDKLRDKHKVSEGERTKHFGDAKELYFFNVKLIDRFESPRYYKREKGVHTFIKEVKFKEEKKTEPRTALGMALDEIKNEIETVDVIDAIRTLTVAKNIDLKILSNDEAKELHGRIHKWHKDKMPENCSLKDVNVLHRNMVDELKKRKMKHDLSGDSLDEDIKNDSTVASSVILSDLRLHLPDEIAVENFVSCVGPVAEGKERVNACDIVFKSEGRCFDLEDKIKAKLGKYNVHITANSKMIEALNIPLYDLKLIKKPEFKVKKKVEAKKEQKKNAVIEDLNNLSDDEIRQRIKDAPNAVRVSDKVVETIVSAIRMKEYENGDFKAVAFNLAERWFDLKDKKTGKVGRVLIGELDVDD